jgi:hypothetical protein
LEYLDTKHGIPATIPASIRSSAWYLDDLADVDDTILLFLPFAPSSEAV